MQSKSFSLSASLTFITGIARQLQFFCAISHARNEIWNINEVPRLTDAVPIEWEWTPVNHRYRIIAPWCIECLDCSSIQLSEQRSGHPHYNFTFILLMLDIRRHNLQKYLLLCENSFPVFNHVNAVWKLFAYI